ncbi:helix-turn-helix domain-containing protein [Allokutzneria sp. A3M-2-11 16]|uniref:nSTAND1 domain-containing NTPase n=1 Tax=Allokutzneria sp. A3M-2-11 16 TaxID=2962043 RepID=UPI0020B842DA|nr:helix-turn-helix domain-containing protein [Allokutzneria sp. A3M-2-11 16]MCP3803502.1 helix-turn-helix domain-containing protein [Allokutzneria sp. A3M-2-11 16]
MPRSERPLDTDGSTLTEFAVDLRKLRVRAGSPPYRELARLAHYSATTLSDAASGRKLPSLDVTVAYARACGGDPEEWDRRWHEVAAAVRAAEETVEDADTEEWDDVVSPYVGLTAFGPEDAEWFFGREKLTGELLDRLGERRFLAVFGASGVGKSSLLRAGLVPATRGPVAIFVPGARPLEECAIQLAGFAGVSSGRLRQELADDPRALHRVVREALTGRPDLADLTLVVDQFEEVFTLCDSAEERARFITALITATTEENSRCRVVLGVRADFYAHCTGQPGLAEALRDAQFPVGPMTTDELRSAIVQPARRADCAVEGALLATLIAETNGQAGVLPLLSHALLETWRRRRGHTLTLAGFHAAGGIDHALAQTAESLYAAMDSGQQRRTRSLFLRLVAPGDGTEDTKRRVRFDELDPAEPDTAAVLDRLARARLLTLHEDSVEITHEALIRCWPRLREWLADDRAGLRVHRQLTEAADAWEALGRDPGSLYRGARLAIARDCPHELSTKERQFLGASSAAEAAELSSVRRRTRRLRQLVALLTVLLVVAGSSTIYAINAGRDVAEQRNTAVARKAAGDAEALRRNNPALARQLSLAAHRLAPGPETRDTLLGVAADPYSSRLIGHTGDLSGNALTPDGRTLVTGSGDRTARVWDVSDILRPRELAALRHAEGLRSVALGAGGRLLATTESRSVVLWDMGNPASPSRVATLGEPARIRSAVLDPAGGTVVTAGEDGMMRLWDVADPRSPTRLATVRGEVGWLSSLAFSHDGKWLAAGGRQVRLWDVGDPRAPRPAGVLGEHGDAVAAIAFSPDRRTAATANFDHKVRLWDIADPERPRNLATLTDHSGIVWSVAFSPDGRTMASTGDGTRLWDVTDPSRVRSLITVPGGIWGAVFGQDGALLVTGEDDRSVRLHDLRQFPFMGHTNVISSLSLRGDGQVLATGSWDGTAKLWHVGDRRLIATIPGTGGFIRRVAFSPDGATLATASDDGMVGLWDVATPAAPRRAAAFTAHRDEVTSLAFRPDGGVLATGSDRSVKAWDVTDRANPRALADLDGHQGVVWSLEFSSDGRVLAAGNDDSGTKLWDVADLLSARELPFPFGADHTVPNGGFSATGRTMAAVDANTVRLLDLTEPGRATALSVLNGHTDIVYAVAFSRDGRSLATSSADKTVRLWDISDPRAPRALAVLTGHTSHVGTVVFHPDGHRVISGSNDRTVRVWDIRIERAVEHVCAVARPGITQREWERHFPGMSEFSLC